jgi:hypothetical protein
MSARIDQRTWQATPFTPAASLRTFALIVSTLGILYLAVDFTVNGLFSSWLFEVAVVEPVETRYGFDAEWRPVNGAAHLVIVAVNPAGRFHRAGIRSGYAFAPARCGWFAMTGGWYALLGNASGPTSVPLETTAGDMRTETSFSVR